MTWARRFVADRAAVGGLIVLAALVALAVLGPLFAADPLARDLDHGLTARGAPLGPSSSALLGTDPLGRDVLARLASAAGTSLAITGAATALGLLLALAVGLTAGYRGGWVDTLLMRGVDLVLAFPFLMLAILLAALLRETSLAGSHTSVVVVLAVTNWCVMARVIRAKAMVVTRSEHVVAARTIGAGPWRIVTRHVLPGALGVIVVVAVATFAQSLLSESVLSFLGLGPPPPASTWGRMLYEGRAYYRTAPHLVLVPGIAIVAAVASIHVIAEGLRRALTEEPR